jgi:hypothetical protein
MRSTKRAFAFALPTSSSAQEPLLRVSPQALFGISVGLSCVAWGIIVRRYLWPALSSQRRADALRDLLLLHTFRFVGLAFLVPGVVSPDLPAAFARPAAYGDLATAILALLAIAALRSRPGTILVWALNIVGSADLLYAFYEGNRRALGSRRGCRVLPTSFRPFWYHCCSSPTVLCSDSCSRSDGADAWAGGGGDRVRRFESRSNSIVSRVRGGEPRWESP